MGWRQETNAQLKKVLGMDKILDVLWEPHARIFQAWAKKYGPQGRVKEELQIYRTLDLMPRPGDLTAAETMYGAGITNEQKMNHAKRMYRSLLVYFFLQLSVYTRDTLCNFTAVIFHLESNCLTYGLERPKSSYLQLIHKQVRQALTGGLPYEEEAIKLLAYNHGILLAHVGKLETVGSAHRGIELSKLMFTEEPPQDPELPSDRGHVKLADAATFTLQVDGTRSVTNDVTGRPVSPEVALGDYHIGASNDVYVSSKTILTVGCASTAYALNMHAEVGRDRVVYNSMAYAYMGDFCAVVDIVLADTSPSKSATIEVLEAMRDHGSRSRIAAAALENYLHNPHVLRVAFQLPAVFDQVAYWFAYKENHGLGPGLAKDGRPVLHVQLWGVPNLDPLELPVRVLLQGEKVMRRLGWWDDLPQSLKEAFQAVTEGLQWLQWLLDHPDALQNPLQFRRFWLQLVHAVMLGDSEVNSLLNSITNEAGMLIKQLKVRGYVGLPEHETYYVNKCTAFVKTIGFGLGFISVGAGHWYVLPTDPRALAQGLRCKPANRANALDVAKAIQARHNDEGLQRWISRAEAFREQGVPFSVIEFLENKLESPGLQAYGLYELLFSHVPPTIDQFDCLMGMGDYFATRLSQLLRAAGAQGFMTVNGEDSKAIFDGCLMSINMLYNANKSKPLKGRAFGMMPADQANVSSQLGPRSAEDVALGMGASRVLPGEELYRAKEDNPRFADAGALAICSEDAAAALELECNIRHIGSQLREAKAAVISDLQQVLTQVPPEDAHKPTDGKRKKSLIHKFKKYFKKTKDDSVLRNAPAAYLRGNLDVLGDQAMLDAAAAGVLAHVGTEAMVEDDVSLERDKPVVAMPLPEMRFQLLQETQGPMQQELGWWDKKRNKVAKLLTKAFGRDNSQQLNVAAGIVDLMDVS